MRDFFRRLRYLLNRKRHDDGLAGELAFHREMIERDGGRGGIRLGNELLLREQSRDAWGWTGIDSLAQDLRFSARLLRKSPVFTISALTMLAVGIGVNVAAFSFFNLVMLRPLPVTDPQSLLRFHRSAPNQYWSDVPYPAIAFYEEHTRTLSAVLTLHHSRLAVDGAEKPASAHFVSVNFLRELGANPIH